MIQFLRAHSGVAVTLILVAAVALCMEEFWLRLIYEWSGPFNVDSPIYWAVGRGILNGLVPYRDLFETKPPGIFVLSSLSLWMRGDMSLMGIMQTVALSSIPLAVIGGAVRTHARGHRRLEILILIAATALGLLLALYTADKNIGFQVETFGAAFIAVYAAFIAKHPQHWQFRHTLIASFLLFGGIGMKEPFALTAAACALLLAEHPKDFVRSFIIPVFITGIAGVIALAATGWLMPYLDVYLPEMLGNHIQEGDPLWKRALLFEGTWENIQSFLPSLALLVGLMTMALALRLHGHTKSHKQLVVLLAAGSALYLLLFSIGIGGHFWQHHYTFAVPGYAALFFVFVRTMRIHWHRFAPKYVMGAFAVLTLIASMQLSTPDYSQMAGWVTFDHNRMESSAQYVDAVLDACNIDRYLYLGVNGAQPYGMTEHSPIGPLFLQYDEWLRHDRPEFRAAILKQVDSAFFIVRDSMQLNWMNVPIGRHLQEHFTYEPWPCAAHIPSDLQFEYFFRHSEPDIPLTVSAAPLVGDVD